MAEDEDKEAGTEQQEKPEKGSKKKIIIFVLLGLILIGASVGGTLFFLKSQGGNMDMPMDGTETEDNTEQELQKASAIYYPLKPPYIVNIDAKGRRRYLQAELTILTREEDVIAAIEMHKASVDHTMNMVLSGLVFEEIQSAEGKELLRIQLTTALQDVFKKEISKPGIEAVLFTNFVMQ